MGGVPYSRTRQVDAKRPEPFLTPAEASFVTEKRRLGISDQHIAQMLNRPVSSLDLHLVVDLAGPDERASHHARQTRRPREARQAPTARPTTSPITEAQLPAPAAEVVGGNVQGVIRSFVERLENLKRQKAQIAEDEKATLAEAKSAGLTPATLRKVIAWRAKDETKRQAERDEFDAYLHAVQGDLFGENA